MERIITPENLNKFAYVNAETCKRPIRGVVVCFVGLGGAPMFDESNPIYDAQPSPFFSEHGILYTIPYCNPWCWMNRDAVEYVDEVVDAIFEKFSLPENTPIVSKGSSMGGLSSLVYTVYAKRTPVACVANCPVCDLPYHCEERPDLPRTLYSAFHGYEGTLADALKTASPLHLADRMPKIPYHIFHVDTDTRVNFKAHSVRFVEEMKRLGHEIDLHVEHDRWHCNLGEELNNLFLQFCVDAVEAHLA